MELHSFIFPLFDYLLRNQAVKFKQSQVVQDCPHWLVRKTSLLSIESISGNMVS